jgi:putative flippase GtrA
LQVAIRLSNSRILRFLIVGGVVTVIDFILINLFSYLGLAVVVSNLISTGIAMSVSFMANRKFTFGLESERKSKEIILFLGFTLFGLWIIQNLVIIGLLNLIPVGWPEFFRLNLAKIIATIASMTWNYLTYSKYVFKKD